MEIIIGLAVFFIAILVCHQKIYWTEFEGKVSQVSLAPALSMACDGKFQTYKLPSSQLIDFVLAKSQHIHCDEINQQQKIEASGFEKAHLYLLSAVGLFWLAFGMTWQSVILFCAVMYAITILATYMLLRLWLPRLMALCFTAIFGISTVHLAYIPWLRDYSKAPFILLLLFITGWLISKQRSARQTYWMCGLGGAIAGMGMGFRMDVILFVPVLLLTICLMPVQEGRWKDKITALTIFLSAFLLVGFPIIQTLDGGSNIYHFALLGLTDPFNGPLGVESAQHDLGGFYNDFFIFEAVAAYNQIIGHVQDGLFLGGAQYDNATKEYYIQLISTFPGDVAARYLAAVLQMFSLVDVRHLISLNGYPWIQSLLGVIGNSLPFVATLIFACLIVKCPTRGVYWLLLFFYVAGYPGLQFDPRHYFHLQPVFFLLFGVGALESWRALRLRKIEGSGRFDKIYAGRSALLKILGVAVIIWMTLASGLWGLRYIQQNAIDNRLPSLESGSLNAVSFNWIPGRSIDSVLLTPIFQNKPSAFDFYYLALEYDLRRCGRKSISMRLLYDFQNSYADFSRNVVISQGEQGNYLFPTFSGVLAKGRPSYAVRQFMGLEVPSKDASCIAALRIVKYLKSWPITASIQISGKDGGWIYQKIKRYESVVDRRQRNIEALTFSQNADLNEDQFSIIRNNLKPPEKTMYSYIAPEVAWINGEAIVKGNVGSVYSYLLQLPHKQWDAENYFVVTGVVREGGLTVGILKNNAWEEQVNIVSPGAFRVAIKMPPGAYVPTIANNVSNGKENNVAIEKIGWMSASELSNALGK